MRSINCNITPGTDAIAGAFTDQPESMPIALVPDPANPGRCALELPDAPFPQGPIGLNVVVMATGFQKFEGRVTLPPYGQTEEGISIELKAGTGPFPPAPDRSQVCGLSLTFQGLTVTTRDFGTLPWFEPGYQCLGPEDRAAVRAAKHAAGDTHLILEFFTDAGSIYDEPGQPYQDFLTPSMEQNPAFFLSLVEEVIAGGFIPVVVFDGDAGDDPAHGYPNALRQLPILVNLLRSSAHGDLNAYVLYARFWDGVFYGSTPEHIAAFGQAFRALLPDGYLAIEHQPGRIPCGEGGGDYQPGGAMTTYDVIVSEFNWPVNDDATWQVIGRMVRPYVRPSDQPSGDDPDPPFYLAPGSPRGPFVYCAFEFAAYQWVRSQVTAEQIASQRAYLRALGCTFTG